MIGFKIEGLEEFKKVFKEWDTETRRKFFVDEFKPLSSTIEAAMKEQTPVYKGKYWTSKAYASRNHPRGTLRASIGKKIGGGNIPVVWISLNRKKGYDAWYNHIVVGGKTYQGVTKEANPIVVKTWNTIGPLVTSQLENRLKNKLKVMMQ